jgi:uncharacterized protein YkwD
MTRVAFVIGAVLFIVLIAVRLGRRPEWRPAPPASQVQIDPIESRIMELVNDARAQVGAAPLVISDRLTLAARAHSDDMAVHRYLAHDSAAGDTPADRVVSAGLDYEELAENLLNDPGRDRAALPQRALASWLASPTPRNNLLAPQFLTAAVGLAHAADGSYYVTLELMR